MRLIFFLLSLVTIAIPGLSAAAVMELNSDGARQQVTTMDVFPHQVGSDSEILDRLAGMKGEPAPYGSKVANAFEEVWLRLELKNQSDKDLERVVYLPNNFSARNFDFYFYRDGVFLEHRSYQHDRAEPGDAIIGRSSYTMFVAPEADSLVLYIKANSGYEPLSQNFQLSSRQNFINWEVLSTLFVGLFLGILFLTVLANFMQAAAYRDKTFLWYSAYCACMLFSSLSFYGIWVRMLSMWETQKYFSYLGGTLPLIAGVMFVRPLLETQKLAPRLDKLLLAVPYIGVVSIVLRFMPSTTLFGYALQNINSILFTVLACVAGVVAMLRGKELAWLYTSSFLFFATSVVYLRLSHLNVVPSSPSAFYAPAVGHIMQIIMISYVMFVRSRTAYSEMLTSQRNRNINERLNLLLKIIAHDIANPLQAISLYCNMALHKVKAEQLPQKELEKALEAITTQTRIIQHAKEAVRQMQLGQQVQVQPVAVSQIMAELLQVFQPLCQDRDINLEVRNELSEDVVIHTDPTILVHSIFGNILSNSIKFSPKMGLIQIWVRLVSHRLIFDLVDNGPGISKEKRLEIFTLNMGRSINEQLTSAGSFGLSILHLCSELLQGQLEIGPSHVSDSGQEQGLRITVSFPLHHAL